jgi:hypothetical protein
VVARRAFLRLCCLFALSDPSSSLLGGGLGSASTLPDVERALRLRGGLTGLSWWSLSLSVSCGDAGTSGLVTSAFLGFLAASSCVSVCADFFTVAEA